MAGLKEFHSFIGKFVNLWQSGRQATLQVNTQAGEATISLEVNLGQALPYPHHQQQQREPGPSRLHRRQRRANACKPAEEAANEKNSTEEVDTPANADAESEPVAADTEEVTENVTESTDDCEDSFIEGNIPQLDGEPAQGFIENDGKEAFECLQCKLLFIPGSHMHGNTIFEYEACRRHYGVSKCKNCALPLIGLDRTRAHMERCHEPA